MCQQGNQQLVKFLDKIRSSTVEYDDYWIERLVKALPKGSETKDAIMESLKYGAEKQLDRGSYYYVHLCLIRVILSSSDANFWGCDVIKNFVLQFLKIATVDHPAVAALFLLFCELEGKKIHYEEEEGIEKALYLLNDNADMALKTVICNYLDKVFERKYSSRWAFAVAGLLKASIFQSSHSSLDDSELRKRLSKFLLRDPNLLSAKYSQELFVMAKDLPARTKYVKISDTEVVSTNFHFCKLLAELVQRNRVDEKLLFDDRWCCIYVRNEILLHLIAMGRMELIKVLLDTTELCLLDLVNLRHYSNETNSLFLDMLLQKSKAWNTEVIPVLAAKAIEGLSSSEWECRDTALSQLTILAKYGYSNCDLMQRVVDIAKNDEEPYVRRGALSFINQVGNPEETGRLAADVLLSDFDSTSRIEAAKILLNGLPQTEKLCLEIIPKILYDEDVALHHVVIEICAELIADFKNNELRDLLVKFEEDEVDCYDELNEMLHGSNSSCKGKGNDDLDYIFNALAQMDEEEHDKDCYDL